MAINKEKVKNSKTVKTVGDILRSADGASLVIPYYTPILSQGARYTSPLALIIGKDVKMAFIAGLTPVLLNYNHRELGQWHVAGWYSSIPQFVLIEGEDYVLQIIRSGRGVRGTLRVPSIRWQLTAPSVTYDINTLFNQKYMPMTPEELNVLLNEYGLVEEVQEVGASDVESVSLDIEASPAIAVGNGVEAVEGEETARRFIKVALDQEAIATILLRENSPFARRIKQRGGALSIADYYSFIRAVAQGFASVVPYPHTTLVLMYGQEDNLWVCAPFTRLVELPPPFTEDEMNLQSMEIYVAPGGASLVYLIFRKLRGYVKVARIDVLQAWSRGVMNDLTKTIDATLRQLWQSIRGRTPIDLSGVKVGRAGILDYISEEREKMFETVAEEEGKSETTAETRPEPKLEVKPESETTSKTEQRSAESKSESEVEEEKEERSEEGGESAGKKIEHETSEADFGSV